MEIRLILDAPGAPDWNMAVDEMLLDAQEPNPPVLRVYAWDRPAYSVGYFQSVAEVVKRFDCERLKIPVVRRPSGGGSVRHGKDVTFSLCADESSGIFPRDVKESYLKVNEALLSGLRPLAANLDFTDCKSVPRERKESARICFEEPSCYDLSLAGLQKIVGSSQRRRSGRILHQSSVFLEKPFERVRDGILAGFKSKWGARFVSQPLTPQEMDRAELTRRERYGLPDWFFLADSFLAKQSGQL